MTVKILSVFFLPWSSRCILIVSILAQHVTFQWLLSPLLTGMKGQKKKAFCPCPHSHVNGTLLPTGTTVWWHQFPSDVSVASCCMTLNPNPSHVNNFCIFFKSGRVEMECLQLLINNSEHWLRGCSVGVNNFQPVVPSFLFYKKLNLREDVDKVKQFVVSEWYVVGSKSFRPDQLFKVTEIKQLCYFST